MGIVIALLAGKEEIHVTDWRLLQTYHPRWHIFGRFGAARRLWITQPLVFQDVRRLVAESANGLRYRLVGEPGVAAVAASFVECCATFDARLVTTLDVTSEFLDLRKRVLGEYGFGSREGA